MSTARRWPYLVPLLVILVLLGIFAKRLIDVEHGDNPNLIPSVLLNTPLPSFDLPGLPGRSDDRGLKTDDLKGEVTLLNVWGSWCVACLEEHPNLVALAKAKAVPIDGIAWRDTPERALAWLQTHGDPYARIGQDPKSDTAIALGVTGAPETFVIDAQGVIRYKQIGPITPKVWQDKIAPLIAKLRQ
jgi:cytochrome c biogenesis protein CcmG/thiol:disulfide interchange protein DsbE